MAIRSNHYDAAFEACLRSRRIPYVAVDESRRALLTDSSLKSFDFIVETPGRWNLLVDVKGRRFPSGGTVGSRGGHLWENWATQDDLAGLLEWQRVFGERFRGLLVFAYDLLGERWRTQHSEVFEFRRRSYAFYGVWADEFAAAMSRRSPQWATVTLPAVEYRRLRQPLQELLAPLPDSHPLLGQTG